MQLMEATQETSDDHRVEIPLFTCKVPAGFPNPADDHKDRMLDLHKLMVSNPSSTFFSYASSDSMIKAGIYNNTLMVIDRSLTPVHGDIVLAYIDGGFTVKRLHLKNEKWLLPENPDTQAYKPIPITEDTIIWGVVSWAINKFR